MDNEMSQSVTGAEHIGSVKYAGFWLRVVASLIDSVLLVILSLIVMAPALLNPQNLSWVGIFNIVASAFTIVWVLLFWHWRGATPGKMVFGLVIVDANSLQKPSFAQLLLRYVGYIASTVLLMLGYIWVGIDARKQGWHDKIANTVVVKKSSLAYQR